jgi:hypothetical protein
VIGLFAIAAIAFNGTSALRSHAGALSLVTALPAMVLVLVLVLVLVGPGLAEWASARSRILVPVAAALAPRLAELGAASSYSVV